LENVRAKCHFEKKGKMNNGPWKGMLRGAIKLFIKGRFRSIDTFVVQHSTSTKKPSIATEEVSASGIGEA
jgi:hypothetical protein